MSEPLPLTTTTKNPTKIYVVQVYSPRMCGLYVIVRSAITVRHYSSTVATHEYTNVHSSFGASVCMSNFNSCLCLIEYGYKCSFIYGVVRMSSLFVVRFFVLAFQ